MATITLKGQLIHTIGNLPPVGSRAPDFSLTRDDLTDVSLASFKGKRKILNIVPSLDTNVCATSAKRFNEEVGRLPNVVLLNISADLPFAQKRFCESNGLKNIVTLSVMRSPDFGIKYGVAITDGPLAGLLSRAVVVLDEQDTVLYTEQVPEITSEPNYSAAVAAVSLNR